MTLLPAFVMVPLAKKRLLLKYAKEVVDTVGSGFGALVVNCNSLPQLVPIALVAQARIQYKVLAVKPMMLLVKNSVQLPLIVLFPEILRFVTMLQKIHLVSTVLPPSIINVYATCYLAVVILNIAIVIQGLSFIQRTQNPSILSSPALTADVLVIFNINVLFVLYIPLEPTE